MSGPVPALAVMMPVTFLKPFCLARTIRLERLDLRCRGWMTNPAGSRILIVDDDPSVLRSLQRLLSRQGYQVLEACDGNEAIRVWRDQGADLVITDLHMPKKDGIQTIIELLSHTPGIRIIAMSGGGQTKRLDLLGSATMLGVLTIEKPFTLLEMMTVVDRAFLKVH
jgi:CheY-like chemotaxis protein